MKKFFSEFKDFVMRGNVVDLAVAVIVGGAFQAIINSLINDLVMPFIGLITGGVNFADQYLVLKVPQGAEAAVEACKTAADATAAGATVWAYGTFITAVINFIVMAFVVFLLVKLINKAQNLKKKEEVEEEPTTKKCPYCCSEIDVEAVRCPHCTSEIKE